MKMKLNREAIKKISKWKRKPRKARYDKRYRKENRKKRLKWKSAYYYRNWPRLRERINSRRRGYHQRMKDNEEYKRKNAERVREYYRKNLEMVREKDRLR